MKLHWLWKHEPVALCVQDRTVSGIYHWSGSECMTKYDMVVAIGSAFGLSVNHIQPDNNQPTSSRRPYDTHLSTGKIEALGIGRQTSFHEGITECLKSFCSWCLPAAAAHSLSLDFWLSGYCRWDFSLERCRKTAMRKWKKSVSGRLSPLEKPATWWTNWFNKIWQLRLWWCCIIKLLMMVMIMMMIIIACL